MEKTKQYLNVILNYSFSLGQATYNIATDFETFTVNSWNYLIHTMLNNFFPKESDLVILFLTKPI